MVFGDPWLVTETAGELDGATRAARQQPGTPSYHLTVPARPWRPCARTWANVAANYQKPGRMFIVGNLLARRAS